MISGLDSGSSGPGLSRGQNNYFVTFLGKTSYSHSASLNPVLQMGTGEFNFGGNPAIN